MTQEERDRLVTLKKAKQKKITQGEAAADLSVTVRQVRRMVKRLIEIGDKSVIHGLNGKLSNHRIDEAVREKAMGILSQPVYEGFGPTLAMEYLRDEHGISVSKETTRQWMIGAELWRAKKPKCKKPHVWRPRRSRFGELVQWDTSNHDWLEGRGEKLYLIAMIEDATSRLMARFVSHDSTAENMRMLWSYLEKNGRPLAFYTDRASLFQTQEKRQRDEPGVDKDPVEMPPPQIGRALKELGIVWIGAYTAQAKGRVERNFRTAQDRLVKGMRVAGVKTLAEANQYLEQKYLPWWQRTRTTVAASPEDAQRALEATMDLAGVLSEVETRQVGNDYTIRFHGQRYVIARRDITSGLRKATVRVEQRLDGSVAVRHDGRYLTIEPCAGDRQTTAAETRPKPARRTASRGSDWNKNFDLQNAPPLWQAAQSSGHRRQETE